MTKNQLFYELGTSVSEFARTHKFKTSTVHNVINRWLNKRGIPRGKTLVILKTLEKEIKQDIFIKY